jgi:nucleoside-diphosphate-sugar epimerase
MKFLFFGMGYSSLTTAHYLKKTYGKDIKITGTVREIAKAQELEKQAMEIFVFDGLYPNPKLDSAIEKADYIIHSIAPNENGDAVYNHFLSQLKSAKNLKWLCYFSTVGVYGNHNGLWVDEDAKCEPKNIRSLYRLKAENLWLEFAKKKDLPLMVLRLAGIYGLGRSSFDKLKNGTAKRIVKPYQVFNRIHVNDIARTTSLAAKQKLNGIFNLSDDEPAPPQDVVEFASILANIAPPPEQDFLTANMSEMARSFYNDNKHVSNIAIKKALDIKLLYPNYRVGLEAIYHSQNSK